jgi:hypothetical protein
MYYNNKPVSSSGGGSTSSGVSSDYYEYTGPSASGSADVQEVSETRPAKAAASFGEKLRRLYSNIDHTLHKSKRVLQANEAAPNLKGSKKTDTSKRSCGEKVVSEKMNELDQSIDRCENTYVTNPCVREKLRKIESLASSVCGNGGTNSNTSQMSSGGAANYTGISLDTSTPGLNISSLYATITRSEKNMLINASCSTRSTSSSACGETQSLKDADRASLPPGEIYQSISECDLVSVKIEENEEKKE